MVAELRAELRRARGREALNAEISRMMLGNTDPRLLIMDVAQRVMDFLPADFFFTFDFNAQTNSVSPRGAAGLSEEFLAGITHEEMQGSVCAFVAASGTPQVLDESEIQLNPRAGVLRRAGARFYACFPLRAGHQLIGTFGFGNREARVFTDDDLVLINQVALVFALALERQRIQTELQLNNERFRLALKNSPTIVFAQDCDLRYTWIYNPSHNLPAESILGKTDDELGGPVVMREAIALKREVLATGRPIRREVCIHFPDGNEYFDLTADPVHDPRGVVVGLMASATEVTSLRRAEQALRERENQLRTILEHLPAGVWYTDASGTIIYGNPAGRRIWGGGPSVAVDEYHEYKGWWPDTGKLIEAHEWPLYQAVKHGKVAMNDVIEIEAFDGTRKFIRNSAVPLRDPDGNVRGGVVINEDITAELRQQRELEQARRASERSLLQLRTLIDNMSDGVCLAGPGGEVISINRAFARMHGLRDGHDLQRELEASPINWEVRDHRGRLLALEQWPFTRLARGEQFSQIELHVRHRSGKPEFHASASGVPLFGEDGSLELGILTLHDITEQKRVEKLLRESNEQLERRVAERTAAARNRALRLRHLAGQLAQTEQQERRRLADLLHNHLQQLLVAATMRLARLKRMVEPHPEAAALAGSMADLLRDAVQETRSLTVELSPPILRHSGLSAALRWLADQMKQKHELEVRLQIAPELDQLGEELNGFVFETVRELLFNVAKHSGVREAVVRAWLPGPREAQVRVHDAGRGCDPEQLGERRSSHTGFGLFSISERVALLGGRLDFETAPGQGFCSILTLPLGADGAPPMPDPESTGAPLGTAIAPRPTFSGKAVRWRVLVADDHPIVREGLVRRIEEEEGMIVVAEAADGEQAVHLAMQLRPDVIILDVNMPRCNGIEAARAIQAQWPEAYMIGLSINDDASTAEAMRQAGAAAYLTKDGPIDDLIQAIQRAGGRA